MSLAVSGTCVEVADSGPIDFSPFHTELSPQDPDPLLSRKEASPCTLPVILRFCPDGGALDQADLFDSIVWFFSYDQLCGLPTHSGHDVSPDDLFGWLMPTSLWPSFGTWWPNFMLWTSC